MSTFNYFHKIFNLYKFNKIDRYIEIGSYLKAEKILKLIIDKDGQNIRALRRYAQIAMLNKNWPAAVERWEQVVEAAETTGKKTPKNTKRNLKNARIKYSKQLYENGQFEEAEEQLKNILPFRNKDLSAMAWFALISSTQGNWPAAVERWEQVVEAAETTGKKTPKNTKRNLKEARIKYSKQLYENGQFEEAEEQLKNILPFRNKDLSAMARFALISSTQGNWPAAVERWEQVVEAAETTGKKTPKNTKRNLKEARLNYAAELSETGQLHEAKRQLEKLIAQEPDNLKVKTRLSDIYFDQGNWPAAIEGWERVISEAEVSEKKLPRSEAINLIYFKRYLEAGLLSKRDYSYIDTVQSYWLSNYGTRIDPSLHIAFYNLTGRKDNRIIPRKQMWNEIIPFFNDMDMWVGYSDKNIYDKLICNNSAAFNVLKRVRGSYFDAQNNCITAQQASNILLNHKNDLIIKPSKTDNGIGIRKIVYYDNALYLSEEKIHLNLLEKIYGSNFIVQEVIHQHPVMAAPHPSSVNTLRIVTFRWKNEIIHLLTFARFGTGGSIRDNAGRGGLCCGITDSGQLMDYAIDEHTTVFTNHPTTKYCFAKQAAIPNYDHFIKFTKNLHKDILHFDFISWDIVVGTEGEPVFLEANYRGATWLYQLATQRPIFGDLTEEVLQHVSSELEKDINIRNLEANFD